MKENSNNSTMPIFFSRKKAKVTAGFICAPLTLPTGEYTTIVAPPAKRIPVKSSLKEYDGILSRIKSVPKFKTMAEMPIKIIRKVPINSER
jgi:hypothetical protein